ncbi:hypothetical protein D2T31_03795 [Sinirhodobacter populi]|uniref:Fatty acid desaturase domain-containing protein n=1 Tax=Paenirhodobacter populi TaxID=2306993 RepID=A0A443KH64_9RHOB|nr:fatty acid desaturase [Sinirhodobacter populi]RWR32083.1 hypothetical protein D2T31_03795 [Sinirhodobacter populi]
MVITKPVHQLQNTIEHLGLSHEPGILENTRSTRTNALFRWLCWQMPCHTAHHIFPSAPFWRLRNLNDKIESKAGEVWCMGWIEFQIELIRNPTAKDASQYPRRGAGARRAQYPDRGWMGRNPGSIARSGRCCHMTRAG